jgi:hypothetical protein
MPIMDRLMSVFRGETSESIVENARKALSEWEASPSPENSPTHVQRGDPMLSGYSVREHKSRRPSRST